MEHFNIVWEKKLAGKVERVVVFQHSDIQSVQRVFVMLGRPKVDYSVWKVVQGTMLEAQSGEGHILATATKHGNSLFEKKEEHVYILNRIKPVTSGNHE